MATTMHSAAVAGVPVDLIRPSNTELKLGLNEPSFGGLMSSLRVGKALWHGVKPTSKPFAPEIGKVAAVKPVLLAHPSGKSMRALAWLRGSFAPDGFVGMKGATLLNENATVVLAEEAGDARYTPWVAQRHIQRFLAVPGVREVMDAEWLALEAASK